MVSDLDRFNGWGGSKASLQNQTDTDMSTPMTSTEIAGYKAGLRGESGWDTLHSEGYNEARRAGNEERQLTIAREELLREIEKDDD